MYTQVIDYFSKPGGLAVLHLIQFIIFGLMAAILIMEYRRLRLQEMFFKLIASASISVLNLFLAMAQYHAYFSGGALDQHVIPLVSNLITAIVILILTRAFIFDYVPNQRMFLVFLWFNAALAFAFYIVFQINWSAELAAQKKYAKTTMQLATSVHLILLLAILMWQIKLYRKKFQIRLYIAFGAVMLAQLVTVLDHYLESIGALAIIRAIVPVIRPIMFGSIIFHELIHANERMNESLVSIFGEQQAQLAELQEINKKLGNVSESLFNKSMESWETLTSLRDDLNRRIFDKIQKAPKNLRENFEQKISLHSRELEELASMSEELQSAAQQVSKSTQSIQSMQEKIAYVQKT